MMSVWTFSVLFLGVLVSVRPSTATGVCEGLSTNLFDLMATFNGKYSNCVQRGYEAQEYDLVQLKIIPLALPSYSQEPLIYLEEATNGWVHILILGSLTEEENGIVVLTLHGFTNDTQRFKFDEYNLESLSTLKPVDIKTNESCKAVFQQLGDGNYLVNFPDCANTVNGLHPTFSIVHNCEGQHVIMPAGGSIKPVLVPYRLKRFGDRYPVPGAANDYVSPCRKKRYSLNTD